MRIQVLLSAEGQRTEGVTAELWPGSKIQNHREILQRQSRWQFALPQHSLIQLDGDLKRPNLVNGCQSCLDCNDKKVQLKQKRRNAQNLTFLATVSLSQVARTNCTFVSKSPTLVAMVIYPGKPRNHDPGLCDKSNTVRRDPLDRMQLFESNDQCESGASWVKIQKVTSDGMMASFKLLASSVPIASARTHLQESLNHSIVLGSGMAITGPFGVTVKTSFGSASGVSSWQVLHGKFQ